MAEPVGLDRWLPPIVIDGIRYWLPRGAALESALTAALVTPSGDRCSHFARWIDVLRHDPAALIWVVHHRVTHFVAPEVGPGDPRASLGDLAHDAAHHAASWFSSGDFVDPPQPSPAQRRRITDLRDQFAMMPVDRWLARSDAWFELTGPRPDRWGGRRVVIERWEQVEEPIDAPESEADPLATLAVAMDRLRTLSERFDDEVERRKRSAVGEMAYGLSHELNNPLANIATRAQTILDSLPPADPPLRVVGGDNAATITDEPSISRWSETLTKIIAQSYRGYGMIADLMFYARPPEPQFAPVDLVAIVHEVLGEFDRDGVRTRMSAGSPRSMPFHADAIMIGEAVRMLVQNAVEAIEPSGTVIAEVARQADQVVVRITDSGPGFSEDARRHAMDPYYSGREAGRGLGVGMCRAMRIVQLHGGELKISSGTGGVVEMRLPPPSDSRS